MSCPAIRDKSTQVNLQQQMPGISAYPESDLYANLDDAYNKSDSMIEFQYRLTKKNSLYDQDDGMLASPGVTSINQSLQKILTQNQTRSPRRSEQLSSQPENLDENVDEIMNSLYTPEASYPPVYPLYRTERYDPDRTGSELLEGFVTVTDNGMGTFRTILWILLIAVVIYGIYYLYTETSKNATVSNKTYGIFDRDSFGKKIY